MLDIIEAIPHLETLKYSGYDVYSYQPTYIMDYPRIVHLPDLEVADVTTPGCGLELLQCLEAPKLNFVHLDGEREMGYREEWIDGHMAQVSALIKRLPQRAPYLQRLDLHHIHFLHAETYAWLINQTEFTRLEELFIESSNIADPAFILPSTLHGQRLRRIELRGCKHITDSGLMIYIKARRVLGDDDFQLLVSGCPGVRDEHLARLYHLGTAEEVDADG